MKISEYVVVIYNFQTGIANRSILVGKFWKISNSAYGCTMVAATMKISEYVVVIFNFQTGIANRSILVKKDCLP